MIPVRFPYQSDSVWNSSIDFLSNFITIRCQSHSTTKQIPIKFCNHTDVPI